MEEKAEKIDIFSPALIMAFIIAGMSDFSFLFLIGLLVPVIGLVVAMFVVLGHWFAGFFVAFLVFPKITQGTLLSNVKGAATLDVGSAMLLIAKVVLALAIILPLPLLTGAIFLAIVLANKFVQFAATVALIAGTGGAGAAAKGAQVAAKGAKVAGTAAKAAGTAERTAAAGGKVTRGAETGAKATETARGAEATTEATEAERGTVEAAAKKPEVPKEAFGEEPTPFEKLQKLTEEPLSKEKQKEGEDEEDGENPPLLK